MSRNMALAGVTAGLATVLMGLGTMIPITTFVCPVICMILLYAVKIHIGARLSWCWYVTVCILSVLLAPDKEAAAVFVFLGWYPVIKDKLDRFKLGIILKLLCFNAAIISMYWLLISLVGMEQLQQELFGDGLWVTLLVLVLGNITFFLLDRVLGFLTRVLGGKSRG